MLKSGGFGRAKNFWRDGFIAPPEPASGFCKPGIAKIDAPRPAALALTINAFLRGVTEHCFRKIEHFLSILKMATKGARHHIQWAVVIGKPKHLCATEKN